MLFSVERLRCIVERITYQSEDGSYSVLKCRAKGRPDLVPVVGALPETHPGAVLLLEGFWKNDAKYGFQFFAVKAEETLPATAAGIEKYLGSGLVKGIGPKTASSIVRVFGTDTLSVIENSPERLLEVHGIGKVRVERIKQSWQEQKEIRDIMLFLQSHDVSTAHAVRIYKTYGASSIDIVRENPYRLAEDVYGIGFRTADKIAEKLGVGKDQEIRLRSGLLYTLNQMSQEGHCFASKAELCSKASGILEVPEQGLPDVLDKLIQDRTLFEEDEALYLPPFYYAEKGAAERLCRLLSHPVRRHRTHMLSESGGMKYDETQLEAVEKALSSKVMILTGGPGTGKTTTTRAIIEAYTQEGSRILLAAPTGRAAKRLCEATGLEARTVHRLLEFKPPGGFQRNEERPLEGDVLIVDECSMLDLLLFYNLLKAVPLTMSLVLVGDSDQLPSVGAGNVLSDLISSGCIETVVLTRIFRQAQQSRIVLNAHRINHGKMIDLSGGRDSDFFFIEKPREEIVDTITGLCLRRLPDYYHVDPEDIQVLTPMQKGEAGAQNLNISLQAVLNPSSLFLAYGGIQYRVRDKVMQIRNNYDKEVFNGDIGFIESVNLEEQTLIVSFDGREVEYERSELDELSLAYAVTVHKAQGSEYPIVVLPMTKAHYMLLERKLLYTAVTRAKRVMVLTGEKSAVRIAINKEDTSKRNTRLAERVRKACPELP